jgi:hypothetical protein
MRLVLGLVLGAVLTSAAYAVAGEDSPEEKLRGEAMAAWKKAELREQLAMEENDVDAWRRASEEARTTALKAATACAEEALARVRTSWDEEEGPAVLASRKHIFGLSSRQVGLFHQGQLYTRAKQARLEWLLSKYGKEGIMERFRTDIRRGFAGQ